jgi:hypothetical protein
MLHTSAVAPPRPGTTARQTFPPRWSANINTESLFSLSIATESDQFISANEAILAAVILVGSTSALQKELLNRIKRNRSETLHETRPTEATIYNYSDLNLWTRCSMLG